MKATAAPFQRPGSVQHHAPAALPSIPSLADDEVHLWRLSLELPVWPIERLYGWLSPDEQARASRYVFSRDREHFVAARGMLRWLLSAYTRLDPSAIHFTYGAYGKPYLDAQAASCDLAFNVSHSNGLGLVAVTRGKQIGVDIERMRPEVDIHGIARSTFSPTEQSRLQMLPPEARVAAFYACWTRKEAYVKARGDGMSYPLESFDVSLAPGEPAALLRSAEGPAECQRWSLHSIDAGSSYAAALIVEQSAASALNIRHLYTPGNWA